MQRFLNLEGVLILIVIGADILIEAVKHQDWVAAAVIIAGFCILGGLYWHTLYLDRLFEDFHASMRYLFHGRIAAAPTQPIPLPASSTSFASSTSPNRTAQDVPAAAIADRPILHVSNFPLSRNFYATVLAPLGYRLTVEFPALSMAAFGINGASDLWIKGGGAEGKLRATFSAPSHAAVDEFCAAAQDAGGTIIEPAREVSERGAGAYAAAVNDPDGYTIEAIFYGAAA